MTCLVETFKSRPIEKSTHAPPDSFGAGAGGRRFINELLIRWNV